MHPKNAERMAKFQANSADPEDLQEQSDLGPSGAV